MTAQKSQKNVLDDELLS